MAKVDITGYARGIARAQFAEGDEARFHVTPGGEQLIAQGLPTETELARQGAIWCTVGSSVTPVIAIPTTAALLSLYNGEVAKSLLIIAVGALETTSEAAAGQNSILARNDVPLFNANPAGALLIFGTSGKQYGGKANAKASVTLGAIGANNQVGWVPVGGHASRVTTTGVGVNAHVEMYGRWIVQPGGLFSISVIAQTAVAGVTPYIVFGEALLTLP